MAAGGQHDRSAASLTGAIAVDGFVHGIPDGFLDDGLELLLQRLGQFLGASRVEQHIRSGLLASFSITSLLSLKTLLITGMCFCST